MKRHLLVALLLLGIGGSMGASLAPQPAAAQAQAADVPLSDATQEARARKLMKDVRCVVCQAQSIDESDAGIASDMRRLIRQEIAAGKSDDDIRQYLVARYGDLVLFKPPFKAATALLWAGPFLLLGFGAIVIVLFFRRRSPAPERGLSAEEMCRVNAALDTEPPLPGTAQTATRPDHGSGT